MTRRVVWFLLATLAVLSCLRDSTAPRVIAGHLAVAPAFESSAAGVVDFDRARITIVRPGSGAILDTVIAIPPAADTIDLSVSVPLIAASEDLLLYLRLINAAGDTVFRTNPYPQPVTVTATGRPTPVETPIAYVGVGFDAVAVAITTPDTAVFFGQTLQLNAAALGLNDSVIPGTPVAWSSLDSTRVRVPNRAVGQVVGGSVRGTARIVAQLLTGPADTVLVAAQPTAAVLSRVSGDSQTAVPGVALPVPLRVRVTAADGLGVRVPVTFVALNAGDSVAPPPPGVVLSDSAGFAEAVAMIGPAAGPRSFRASVSGVATPVTFTATALSGAVASVTLDRTSDTIPRGATLQYTATARDSLGNPVSVSFGWTSTAPGVATVDGAGLASAVAGDSTRITATAAGRADTANLYVRVLRTVVAAPADTVITAIGDSFDLRATAYDNFGAVVPGGFTRTFVSATPTVVTLNGTTGRTRSVGAGNGVVVVRDSVDANLKVQGTATVRVNQVTFSIRNTPALPDTLKVGVGGRRAIQAAALDRNGHPIPNKTFGYRSADAAIATVDAGGIVTGVALGNTFVIDSVDGFKDSVRVAVVTAPPALVQWGFDSLAVGNGGSVSVPLTLSRTDSAPVKVLLASTDTMIARVAASCPGAAVKKVQIPAGTTATSVLICGLAAGRVTIVAQDSVGTFLPDTMVVTVVSTIEFREIATFNQQAYFYVNQNETHRAQVFLSDPAPAGGLGVTFVYAQPGKSAVNPAPAIIPAGQLAADVIIQGLTPGLDSVTPTSGGFVGKRSQVYIAPNNLQLQRPYPYTGTLGVGQTFQPYVGITYAMDHILIVDASLSSGIGTVQTPDTIRANTSGQYFTVGATAPGRTTLTVTAPGWVGVSDTLTFTTPHLVASGSGSLIAGDPTRGSWTAYAADSVRYQHNVMDTLTVTAVSRNPSAVAVDVATVNIPAGASGASRSNALRALPTAGGDSAWIVLSTPGYMPDSFIVRVTKPTLVLQVGYPYTGRLGLGTFFQNAGYVTIPYVRPDTFTVTFGHSRPGVVRGPATVRILPGQTQVAFNLVGDTLGVDTLSVDTAATQGYVVSGGPIVYQVDSLRVRAFNYPGVTNYTIASPYAVTVYAYDPADGQSRPLVAPLRVSVASSNPATFTLDSAAVTIDSGQYYSVNHPNTLRFVGVDTVGARILTSAAGAISDSSNLIKVFPTPLGIQLGYPYTVGRGLRLKNSYVYAIGGNVPDTVEVALQRFDPTLDTLTRDTVVIVRGQNSSQSFEIWALDSSRTDSIVASAPGYVSARINITPEPVSLIQGGLPSTRLTTDPPYRPIVYTGTRSRNTLNPFAPVTVTVVSTDRNVMQIDSAFSVNAGGDTAVAVVDTSRGSVYVRVVFVGSGSARLRYSAPGFLGDSTPLVSVTGPTLNLSLGANQTLGVGQLFAPTASQYVYVSNPVTGSPLVVDLSKSDSTLPPGSQAFTISAASVTIPVGNTVSNTFEVQGNSIGAATLFARTTAGYGQATSTLQIGPPKLVVSPQNMTVSVGQAPALVTVYAEDQGGQTRYVASTLTIGDTAANPAVAASDSLVLQIPARGYYAQVGVRGFVKGATQIVFAAPGYTPDTLVVQVDTAQLTLNSPPNGLGAGQVAPSQMFVSVPFTAAETLTVSLASDNPSVLTVPSQVTIPKGSNYAYFSVTGIAAGTANVSATATGAKPALPVSVRISTPRFLVSLSAATLAGQKATVTVYSQDSVGAYRNPAAPLAVTLVSSVPGHTAFDSTTIRIPTSVYYASTGVVFDTAGSHTLTASAPGYTPGSAATVTTGALVRMVATPAFSPTTVTIQSGQYVTWRNDDAIGHTSTADGGSPAWNSGTLVAGATFLRQFAAPGTFTYHCSIHPGMTGSVLVNP